MIPALSELRRILAGIIIPATTSSNTLTFALLSGDERRERKTGEAHSGRRGFSRRGAGCALRRRGRSRRNRAPSDRTFGGCARNRPVRAGAYPPAGGDSCKD